MAVKVGLFVYPQLSEVVFAGKGKWITRDNVKILLNHKSHPHFDVGENTKGRYILRTVFSKIEAKRIIKPNVKITVRAIFDQPVGYMEYASAKPSKMQKTNIISVVVVKLNNGGLRLVTAFYGDPIAYEKRKDSSKFLKVFS